MASNPKLLQYIEDKIKALIEVRMGNVKEIVVDDALSATSENPVQNKVIKAALDEKLGADDVDDALSATSENPVQNKVVKAAIDAASGGGGSVTVDTAMSDISENPVQNKVIKAYVDGQTPIVDSAFDGTSQNPVQNRVLSNILFWDVGERKTFSTGWVPGVIVSKNEIDLCLTTSFVSINGSLRVVGGTLYVRQSGASIIANQDVMTSQQVSVSQIRNLYGGVIRVVFDPDDSLTMNINDACLINANLTIETY